MEKNNSHEKSWTSFGRKFEKHCTEYKKVRETSRGTQTP